MPLIMTSAVDFSSRHTYIGPDPALSGRTSTPCSVASAPNRCSNSANEVDTSAGSIGFVEGSFNIWCRLLLMLICICPCRLDSVLATTWSFSSGEMLQVLYTTRPPLFVACTKVDLAESEDMPRSCSLLSLKASTWPKKEETVLQIGTCLQDDYTWCADVLMRKQNKFARLCVNWVRSD